MIDVNGVCIIHDKGIEKYGGSKGLRDQAGLESALSRPYQSFAGEELYPSAIAKAAAIVESILINHPFVDGNKRRFDDIVEWLTEHTQ